jgi:hypothetical protein
LCLFTPKQGREFSTTNEKDFHRWNNINFLPHRGIENIGGRLLSLVVIVVVVVIVACYSL